MAAGDSGSGIWLRREGGVHLAGIASYRYYSMYGGQSGYVNLGNARIRDWIESVDSSELAGFVFEGPSDDGAMMDQIFTLFIGYFGRPPAPSGRDYYNRIMEQSDGHWVIIADDFWKSAESQTLHPPGLSTRQQIDAIYHYLYSRSAASEGLDYWEGLITAGIVSLPEMAYTIAYNASAEDLAILDAKRVTAARWSAALDTAAERAAFTTTSGRQAAQAFLADVNTAAPAGQSAVDQAIADMVAASAGL